MQRFGFPPTASQEQALREIDADLASPRRMLRLLQGDVGSGKTLVALLAMLRAVEAGKQAALMAPTEVLAKQHHRVSVPAMPGAGRAADRIDQGQGTRPPAARHQGRVHPDRRRHPRAVPGCGRISRPGGGGDRRAAPVRRQSAPDARCEGRAHRRPDHDRDADPADVAADPVGRNGRQPPDRKTRRAAADSHHAALARHHADGAGRHRPQAGRRRAGLLGLPAGRRKRGAGRRRRAGAVRRFEEPVRRPRSAWRTASRRRRSATPRWPASPPARSGCWSPPRWWRSGSMCRKPR